MVHINTEDCNGCGACFDSCPAGEIFLEFEKTFTEPYLLEIHMERS